MPGLTCYKLHQQLDGGPIEPVDGYLDAGERAVEVIGPLRADDFTATLFITRSIPREPDWVTFLRTGFPALAALRSGSAGALLIVQIEGATYGLVFGRSGRYLLRSDAIQRGFGLRAALNLVYPRTQADRQEGLVAIDTKRHGGQTVRSRRQAARATTLQAFDVDRLRDIVDAATGRPVDTDRFGTRVTGGDGIRLNANVSITEIGELVTWVAEAQARDDYRERFGWIDDIQPVTDYVRRIQLEERVASLLKEGEPADLELAPPEIVDWNVVRDFRYHFDARARISHPDLRLRDYLEGLRHNGMIADLDAQWLRRRHISVLDDDDAVVTRWPVWRCLSGELNNGDGSVVILDEGEFFYVEDSFLARLDAEVARIPLSALPLPDGTATMSEAEYNELAAAQLRGGLNLDQRTIRGVPGTTRVEICDILVPPGSLVHVKRHLGSRDLSHLFNQGSNSAVLLQEDPDFRRHASEKIREVGGIDAPFGDGRLSTGDLEIVFAIVAPWSERTPVQALPFFSKVSLRRVSTDLLNRGFNVSIRQVEERRQLP